MLTLPVRFREGALSDLENIWQYFIYEGASRATVKAFVGRLRDKCELIGRLPYGYPAAGAEYPNLRTAPFEHSAMIFYAVTDDCVEIVNIYYRGRDYRAVLED